MDYIENNIKDCDISYRGGTLKVDLSGYFSNDSIEKIHEEGEEAIAGAYQGYLGGGIAGSIQIGNNFDPCLLTDEDSKLWEIMKKDLIQYFYNINNGGGDDYMQENVTGAEAGGLEKLQKMPKSGY